MTHEERLAVAEARVADLRNEVTMLREDFNRKVEKIQQDMACGFESLSKKLDVINAKLEQGRGAWWAFTKLTAAAGAIIAGGFAIIRFKLGG